MCTFTETNVRFWRMYPLLKGFVMLSNTSIISTTICVRGENVSNLFSGSYEKNVIINAVQQVL